MQSRRDQVQAHLFVMSRLASGMLRADPDVPESPIARTNRGGRIGMVVAVAMSLVVAIYGLIRPGGNTSWSKPGTLVVVKETGARFLYLGAALHPVLNQASARLLAGEQLAVVQVSEHSLSGASRGAPLGIVGAPDELPPASGMARSSWLACGTQRPDQSGGTASQLVLAVGLTRDGRQLTADQGALVSTPDGTVYLLWHGQRLHVDGKDGATQALGFAGTTPFPVSATFVNTLSAGPDLTPPPIAGRGVAGPELAGRATRVGQLFDGPGGHYVLTKAGLVPLNGTLFALLRDASGATTGADSASVPAPIGPADLAAHEAPSSAWFPDVLPPDPPRLVRLGEEQGVCADVHPGTGAPTTTVTVLDAGALGGRPPLVEPGVPPACGAADRIAIRPGSGGLVRALSASGIGSTEYLVTGEGVKYPVPSDSVAGRLGYTGNAAEAVPDGLLGLLPTGPSLDPVALARVGIVGPAASPAGCTG